MLTIGLLCLAAAILAAPPAAIRRAATAIRHALRGGR